VRLRDKVAIITGAGSGIGRESALLFAQEGAKVVIADNVEEAGRQTRNLIGDDAFFVKVDVSNWAAMKRLVDEAVARFGRLDILFSNAGINLAQRATVAETGETEWDRIMAVNLKGVFLGARHALPVMMAQRSGAIINTASLAGVAASLRLSAYCASKGGVVSLTRQLAVDYAPYNIRVNCICPAALEKPVGDISLLVEQFPGVLDERRARNVKRIPLARLGEASDVACAALYLASDESAYVTGIAFMVDGGALAL
jgi:NAD(P)-dependent dehydrogenase (short-subunit alcohol dehydrogenase family)